MRAVQQKDGTLGCMPEDLDFPDQIKFVTGDEICGLDQVRRADRLGPEAQM